MDGERHHKAEVQGTLRSAPEKRPRGRAAEPPPSRQPSRESFAGFRRSSSQRPKIPMTRTPSRCARRRGLARLRRSRDHAVKQDSSSTCLLSTGTKEPWSPGLVRMVRTNRDLPLIRGLAHPRSPPAERPARRPAAAKQNHSPTGWMVEPVKIVDRHYRLRFRPHAPRTPTRPDARMHPAAEGVHTKQHPPSNARC